MRGSASGAATSTRGGGRLAGRGGGGASRGARGRPDDIARSRSAGFDSHLGKPVMLSSLEAELASTNRRL
jgi:hypothetical protein